MKKKLIENTAAAAVLLCLAAFFGCAAPEDSVDSPIVYKAQYMEDGATLQVEDPSTCRGSDANLSILEELKKVSENLEAECEKNAVLAQELISLRDARDQLKTDLDDNRNATIALNEEIAKLKMTLAEQETAINEASREKRDLIEKLVNLRIEKTKVEKELLKVKIAALSGDG